MAAGRAAPAGSECERRGVADLFFERDGAREVDVVLDVHVLVIPTEQDLSAIISRGHYCTEIDINCP